MKVSTKKIFLVFSCLLCTGNAQTNNEEFRATWVITWEHISPDDSPAEGKARIQAILNDHKAANMNAVLFQVRQSGTAYYNSSYEPWGYYAGYSNPGYDPLAYVIQEAHARGIEVHAWFNAFAAASTQAGTPANEHPEWVCRDQDGIAMDSYRALSPGLQAVRDYTIDVAMEIVNNYDIDGLHLDYVRWNEYTNSGRTASNPVEEISKLDGMISAEQLRELNNNRSGRYLYDIEHPYSAGVPSGFSSWEAWWRWCVTEFVSTLHDSIQAVKPYVRLSAAVLGKYNWSGWQGFGTVYQDAALWFNEGYVDHLTPMHYHWTSGIDFYNMLEGSCPNCWSQYIQPGLTAGRHYSVGPGSYVLDENSVWNQHPNIINTSRSVAWVDGFQFFSYGSWDYHNYWETAGTSFFQRRTKIREINSPYSIAPDPPVLSITALDSLNYQLNITLPDSSQSLWCALYRSEDTPATPDNDDIAGIYFSDSSLTITESYDGLQDFNGQYTYYATLFNRFWSESQISNSSETDSIPSFPPMVLATTPSQVDTVQVSTDVRITFSKTIDPTTAQNAVSIVPATNFYISWDADYHEIILTFVQNLEYATDYTITISPELTDINGAYLDGNGDGYSGDSFVLNFTAVLEDIYGPVIFQSNIDFTTPSIGFDVEDVLTIVFDETVNSSTLNNTSIQLSENNVAANYSFRHNEVNEKSVLTIRPSSPFSPNTEYSLQLDSTITDQTGNTMTTITAGFTTAAIQYTEIIHIDEFSSVANWWQPGVSGSTTGILAGSEFRTNTQFYLPGTSPAKSARLAYVWDTAASSHLLREYLASGSPRDVNFDTSYTLQVYLFGDRSNNLFRFCIDEKVGSDWANHEVSQWIILDWIGWRLVEWDLGDASSVGVWIGNQVLDGNSYRIDSFQLTYDSTNGTDSGIIYFDNLRVVQKSPALNIVKNDPLPLAYSLSQNYPNPFNPKTRITFSIPEEERVFLAIYNLTGRHVKTLINNHLPTGTHSVIWNGKNTNGHEVSSGVYIYVLSTQDYVASKRMVYLK